MKKLESGSVQLAFADPPFNIGYDYDEYEDRLESSKYIEWCHQWMTEVHRVLSDNGTFWLAIGDEYAAELKLEAQKVGFVLRSWIVWYYTFGVNCKNKFTRSHAHLFYFVKNKDSFVFNLSDIAVPSARQLIYADKRANPKGRTPDDTWILRPQDCRDSFNHDEDVWYFPRVNGTFKERAGFHGCQMPEQLLGRIVRSTSLPNDLVLDPFAGSGTTLVVAKKLNRRFIGFELSKEYAVRGTERLKRTLVHDPLEGAPDPKTSVPSTDEIQNNLKRNTRNAFKPIAAGFLPGLFDESQRGSTEDIIKENWKLLSRGASPDLLVLDPVLNLDFQKHCDRLNIPETPYERNRLLFSLRSTAKLPPVDIAYLGPQLPWSQLEPISFASEIAWSLVAQFRPDLSLEELFCEPKLAEEFDTIAMSIAPGYLSIELRLAAIFLRRHLSLAAERMARNQSDCESCGKTKSKKFDCDKILEQKLPSSPAVYSIHDRNDQCLYVGETRNLARRIAIQFDSKAKSFLTGRIGNKIHFGWRKLTEKESNSPFSASIQMLQSSPALWNRLCAGEQNPESQRSFFS